MIAKRPVFAALAVAVLALGIGANSAVFSMVNAFILRPLDLPQLDRLVEIREFTGRQQRDAVTVTAADYLDWKRSARSFAGISAYGVREFDLASEGSEPQGVMAVQASADMLHTLGVAPAVGRDFLPGEDEPGARPVALVSDALWRNRFGGDRGIVGREIQIDSRPFLVVGVLPANFEFPIPAIGLWTPLALTPAQRNDRRNHTLGTAARLRDGVSLEQARAELDALAHRLARIYPETNAARGATAVLLRERQGDYSKPFLGLLQATAILVLLIACANLAYLQLAQAVAREREIAIRTALGAGRRRVIRLLTVESLLLAGAGGAAGIVVAYLGVRVLKASIPPEGSRYFMGWNQLQVQPAVLWFTLAIAVASGVVFGLSAAWHGSRVNLALAMKQGGGQAGSKSRLRALLVVGEVALATIATIATAQMVSGFQAMFNVYQGFTPDRILAIRVVLPTDRYDTPHRTAAFLDAAARATATIPGVEMAAFTSNLPGALRFNYRGEMEIEGRPALSAADAPRADFQIIGAGYFAALGIPLRAGRPIEEQDGEDSLPVAVIGQRTAARYFPGENPVGKRIRVEYSGAAPWRTIVGVAGDIHQFWFEKETRPILYLPYRQTMQRSMYLAIRARGGDSMRVLPAVRERMRRLDAALPLREPRPMREVMLETVSAMRMTTGMMTAFGMLALVLAAVGIYGVMAHTVTQRYREFGIRLALGARPGNVVMAVARQGLRSAAWGIGLGFAGGFLLSRAMAGIMYGVGDRSAEVLTGVPALIVVVSLAACWIPARAATAVDPLIALRQD